MGALHAAVLALTLPLLSPATLAAKPVAASQPELSDAAAGQALMVYVYTDAEARASKKATFIAQNQAEAALARENEALSNINVEDARRTATAKAEAMALRSTLFSRQLTYDIFIFIMVMCIVAAGLGFSYLQFTERRSLARRLQPLLKQLNTLAADDPARALLLAELSNPGGSGNHSFEMGPIKVSSNVIGLVVLAMSLAFFYLYLDRVYTIRSDRADIGGAFQTPQLKRPEADAPPAAAPDAPASAAVARPSKP